MPGTPKPLGAFVTPRSSDPTMPCSFVAVASLALAPMTPPTRTPMANPLLGVMSQIAQRPAVAITPMPAALATAAFPQIAVADDGGIVDALVNLVLSGVVLAFLAFIGSYALQAAQAVGESAEAIIEYDKKMAEQQPKQEARSNKKDEAVYDDTGSGAVSDDKIMKEIAERKKRGKGSFQVGADGKKFAPWLVRAGRAATSQHARPVPALAWHAKG